MNCNTTHYRANSSSVPGDPTHQSDGTGTASADYLAETYAAGIASHGWEAIKQKTGSYPLDGIGWHLYMEQTDAAATASLVRSYVGQVWSTVARYEGASSPKSLWISEFGFGTNGTASENDSQATGLDNVFDALAAEPHVKMGMWFTIQDFDSAGWGLYTGGGFDAAHAKPSRARFALQASRKVEGLWAKLAFESPPLTLAPGQTAPVRVKATNLGSEAWKQADNVRLGSGPGCPETPSANALAWVPANGFANSPTDARVFLDAADDVAPAAVKEFAFAVTAPTVPGVYRLSARMVKEGAQWFGTAGELTVIVAAPLGADAGVTIDADAGQPPRTERDAGALSAAPAPSNDAGGCGCRVTRVSESAGDAARGVLATGLLGLVARRRRRARIA